MDSLTLGTWVGSLSIVAGALAGFYVHMSGKAEAARVQCKQDLDDAVKLLAAGLEELRRDYVRRDDFRERLGLVDLSRAEASAGFDRLSKRVDATIGEVLRAILQWKGTRHDDD